MAQQWNILVLGGGRIGQAASHWLTSTGDYSVTMADARPVEAPVNVQAIQLDAGNEQALMAQLPKFQAVLNALPYTLAPTVAKAAAACGVHYFDLTEDVAATRAIEQIAKTAKSVLMPQCGLAPGAVDIIGHDLARRFDELVDLTLRVGALPRFATNAMRYNLTWSTAGLVNEYIEPCDAIMDGHAVKVAALEGHETFAIDGIEFEAFNTSGGLGTLAQTLAGNVRNLAYRTIRYPGHRAMLKLLLEDLRLRDRKDLMCEIFENAIPETNQDIVVVFVSAVGKRNGRLFEESFAARIPGTNVAGMDMSAIQMTTAAGLCTALDLVRSGTLPQAGFVKQEAISLHDFLHNRFGGVYSHAAPSPGQSHITTTAFRKAA